ncbi:MAG TPA: cytochrome c oxidase subunit II [Gemmatimonadaceae bacterium]|jgi:cytochrome c oxidase subunit 2|nr:cytochrome c oxidase subunit II [Gemmatimonadaceae bacterium]
MKVHTYEKAFLITGGIVLAMCASALAYATFGMGMHLPGRVAQIDPSKVYSTAPFSTPGVHKMPDGTYQVILVAQAWAFMPSEIRVPRNTIVNFTATSVDVIHGFEIERTRVNMMLIPGQIGQITHTFRDPGEYLLLCHEYCGAGHHTMFGKVIVE